MVGKQKAPTVAQKRRMEILKTEIGCIACKLDGMDYVPPDIHHIIDGGKRCGHEFSIPLCPPHHGRIPVVGVLSIDKNKRQFIKRYGTELQLLQLTNRAVAWFEGRTIGSAA